jgi:hypothetical protein
MRPIQLGRAPPRFPAAGLLSQSPDLSGATPDSPNMFPAEPVRASGTVAAVSPVNAALRHAEATPDIARAPTQAAPRAMAASMNTMGLMSPNA